MNTIISYFISFKIYGKYVTNLKNVNLHLVRAVEWGETLMPWMPNHFENNEQTCTIHQFLDSRFICIL